MWSGALTSLSGGVQPWRHITRAIASEFKTFRMLASSRLGQFEQLWVGVCPPSCHWEVAQRL